LWESPLLPLDLVIHVDRASPYYNSGGQTTVYSAESRALVHYLLTQAQPSGNKSLEQYIAQVEGGADTLQAARQVFGDLNQLQSRLEAYIKQSSTAPTEIQAAGGSESTWIWAAAGATMPKPSLKTHSSSILLSQAPNRALDSIFFKWLSSRKPKNTSCTPQSSIRNCLFPTTAREWWRCRAADS